MYFRLKLQLIKQDGSLFSSEDTDQPTLAANLLHSMFKSAHVTLNNCTLRSIEQYYHIKEFIEATLNFNETSVKNRHFTQFMNSELHVDSSLYKNSQVFEVYGRLSLISIEKLLLPHVKVNLRFQLAGEDFFITEKSTVTAKAKMKIHASKLYIRHVVPKIEILTAHEKILAMNRNAIYELKIGQVFVHHIPSGVGSLDIPNLYVGLRPSLICFAMVENDVLIGKRSESPFQFKNHNLTSFSFIVNGRSKPENPLEILMSTTHQTWMMAFGRNHENLGNNGSDRSNLLTAMSFIKDKFLIVEDLTSFSTGLTDINESLRTCNVGVKGIFSTPPTKPISVICYVLVPTRFEVKSTREVSLIY